MRNLHVTQTPRVDLETTIVGQCIDADNRRFFLLTTDVKVFEVRGDRREVQQIPLDTKTQQSIGIETIKQDDVIAIEYIVESGSICIVLRAGQFIRIGVSSFSPPSECVYTHQKPICSVKLSPDQDLIALADISNDIFILTADYVSIHCSNALTQSDSAHKPVGVGWGSKETQFFGLDGRPSREKSVKGEITLNDDELATIDKIETSDVFRQLRRRNEKETLVDWRGDGQLLATLTYIPDSDKHYMKVWNRNLELQYMSEQLVTMERGLLSWIPNGQYICTAQRRDKYINEIAMFEKNGMIHQRITLPTVVPNIYIGDILWSPDSAILAIIIHQFEQLEAGIRQRPMLMLYTMQNFHYYLKYTSHLDSGGSQYFLRWDPNNNNILYVTSETGSCVEYNCVSVVDYCLEDSMVAVVDANKVLITPFGICNIPPPMSAITIEIKGLIKRLVLAQNSHEKMAIMTVNNELIYLESGQDSARNGLSMAEVKSNIPANTIIDQFSRKFRRFARTHCESIQGCQNFSIAGPSCLLATRRCKDGTEIVRIELPNESLADQGSQLASKKGELLITRVNFIEDRDVVCAIRRISDTKMNSVLLFLDDHSCRLYEHAPDKTVTRFTLKTTSDRFYIHEAVYVQEFDLVVTLTSDLTLRVEETVIATNCCTSFRTTSNFLIYTTVDHMIHLVPLDRLKSSPCPADIGSWNQIIENGGTLVVASESDAKVILQMPRGNLEILHPRIMVLLHIIEYLNGQQYLEAFMLARKYRVDLNFLADYMLRRDEETFYELKLNKFAHQLAKASPSYLNLFISELSAEDTTCGRYKAAMEFLPAGISKLCEVDKVTAHQDKVIKICSQIKLPPDVDSLYPELLCLIKQDPRKSLDALERIHSLPRREDQEEALKFLLYFINIEQLLASAISTTNTDIALMVASVSSKDPKEYLALLDGFNAIQDEHLRAYRMLCHVKDYERAFNELISHFEKTEDRDAIKGELIEMVVAKRIYKHAVRFCIDSLRSSAESSDDEVSNRRTRIEELLIEIWTRYADYLLEKRYYLEAGLAYCKSITDGSTNDARLDKAVNCFMLANAYERCLPAMERFKMSELRKAEAIKNIQSNLMSRGCFAEAVVVSNPTKNDTLAFELLAKKAWNLAECLVGDESRPKLGQMIDCAVASELQDLLLSLDKILKEAAQQYDRFKELVLAPQKTAQYDMDNCYNADSLSTVDGSEVSSVLSGGAIGNQARVARSGAPSIKTKTSSKSNKSQATPKKRINLKAGSRHEDQALVMELQGFIRSQRLNQDYVRYTLATGFLYMTPLSKFEHTLATEISELLTSHHRLAEKILNDLWPKNDHEDDIFSVYKRFGKLLSTGCPVQSEDIQVLVRPELHSSCQLLEL